MAHESVDAVAELRLSATHVYFRFADNPGKSGLTGGAGALTRDACAILGFYSTSILEILLHQPHTNRNIGRRIRH
jgi:hypothetical protein